MTDPALAEGDAVVDEFGNEFVIDTEVARGGQGVVYRTADRDWAIKQPLNANGTPDHSPIWSERYRRLRTLPIPPGCPVALPRAVLRDQPGYVMRLLSDMTSFSDLSLHGDQVAGFLQRAKPKWLSGVPDDRARASLMHYAGTGATKRRLFVLARAAAILARLHASGLVYCDISPNNCFMGDGEHPRVWLIDLDNVRFDSLANHGSLFTPRYGAPEVVQDRDHSTARSDCWAFAVMAFETLTLTHPFLGRRALDDAEDECGWDADPVTGPSAMSVEEQAFAGSLPFIDDPRDRSNAGVTGLPRSLVLSKALGALSQECFCPGRSQPWRRPALALWALELMRAHDESLACPRCDMTYTVDAKTCPWCGARRPAHLIASTDRWQLAMAPIGDEVGLPHRLFNPFSLERYDNTEFEAVVNVADESVTHVRGTSPLPPGLTFKFVKGAR